jgi:hypothetical protein
MQRRHGSPGTWSNILVRLKEDPLDLLFVCGRLTISSERLSRYLHTRRGFQRRRLRRVRRRHKIPRTLAYRHQSGHLDRACQKGPTVE